ncbi:hypothetical protein [Klebsiella pneumoniae]|uniref:hypothetical protein n=1 Tax=Klebsiella pneumoniae TaxID=573 RepID=UPI0040558FE3
MSKLISALERELRSLKRAITGVAEIGKATTAEDDSYFDFEVRFDDAVDAWKRFQEAWRNLDGAMYELDPECDFPADAETT